MSFSFITGTSAYYNPNDKGDGIPDPVVCDSILDASKCGSRQNADLTIYFKVWFEMVTTATPTVPDADNHLWQIRDWGPADDFPKFCRDAVDATTRAFDNKLTLIPPSRYNGLDRQDASHLVWRPNIRCHFVCLLGDAKYFHAKVKVCIPLPQPAYPFLYRANSRNWTIANAATVSRPYAGGVPVAGGPAPQISQVVAAHEIGHLLGLHHIGGVAKVKDCDTSTESDPKKIGANYGSSDPDPSFANNIMGMGMDVTEFNSLPWRQEMCKHANRHETFGSLHPHEWIATLENQKPKVVVDD